MKEQLEYIRKKCIEANPEIVELKFGCEVGRGGGDKAREFVCGTFSDKIALVRKTDMGYWLPFEVSIDLASGWKILGRPIRLADVLYALNINSTDEKWHLSVSSNFMRIEHGTKSCLWNLRKDSLTDQSEETIRFIYDLLQ